MDESVYNHCAESKCHLRKWRQSCFGCSSYKFHELFRSKKSTLVHIVRGTLCGSRETLLSLLWRFYFLVARLTKCHSFGNLISQVVWLVWQIVLIASEVFLGFICNCFKLLHNCEDLFLIYSLSAVHSYDLYHIQFTNCIYLTITCDIFRYNATANVNGYLKRIWKKSRQCNMTFPVTSVTVNFQ